MHASTVIDRVGRRLFGSPLLRNSIRGEIVEEIVAMALEPSWELCSGDWGACDLVHPASKLRIQVKQSAARQSWHLAEPAPASPRFSIAPKTGRWEEGDSWVAEPGRNAEVFIFAWHPLTGAAADHRDPQQWLFHVVPERDLPLQKSISLASVRSLAPPVTFTALASAVRAAEIKVLTQKNRGAVRHGPDSGP
jgi:hypothetical protein